MPVSLLLTDTAEGSCLGMRQALFGRSSNSLLINSSSSNHVLVLRLGGHVGLVKSHFFFITGAFSIEVLVTFLPSISQGTQIGPCLCRLWKAAVHLQEPGIGAVKGPVELPSGLLWPRRSFLRNHSAPLRSCRSPDAFRRSKS